MANKSAGALPLIKIGPPDDGGTRLVYADHKEVGTLARPVHAPKSFKGFFLRLDGVTWNNSPGARQTADSGYFDATMVRNTKEAMQRIEQHYKDKAEALANDPASR